MLGVDDPYLDVEVIALAMRFYEALGLRRVTLMLNSLGNPDERARYVDALRRHFESDLDALSPESRQTLLKNPLRVLDSKRESDADIVGRSAAPRVVLLRRDRRPLRAGVRRTRARSTSSSRLSRRLVRGLDYYRRTTFEFVGDALVNAQNAVGGGGRYDGLAEDLGGSADAGHRVRARGRTHAAWRATPRACSARPIAAPIAFVVDTTGGREALAAHRGAPGEQASAPSGPMRTAA